MKGWNLNRTGFRLRPTERNGAGLPAERLGLHVCRGNWTKDETAALAGDYRPLLEP